MAPDSLLDKLKKLLAKTTENGATEAEAQSATAMVQRLMDEHNITAAQIDGHALADDYGQGTAWEGAKMRTELDYVAPIVERTCAVHVVICTSKVSARFTGTGRARATGYRVIIFGDPANAEAGAWTLRHLGDAFRNLWERHRIAYQIPGRQPSVMKSYYMGLQHGFMPRLDAQRAATEAAIPGAATALATTSSRLDDAFAAAFPEVREKEITVPINDDTEAAYAAGHRDSRHLGTERPLDHTPARAIAGR